MQDSYLVKNLSWTETGTYVRWPVDVMRLDDDRDQSQTKDACEQVQAANGELP